ncbi:MAG TPA: response regulator transcription factor [Pseudonocardiaceae bacterium]|jgi:DNA-binding response OmpR family regulator|nr:response regulator transcription factor [Pseudonocardiaceae bacterium]
MTRVLLVEDDENLRVSVATQLSAAGLVIDAAGDIATADRLLRSTPYACVVFDRMLPDGDAIGFVHAMRQQGWRTPVLFLTARDALADRVAGFEHGGDDYLVKPFAMAELTARVAILARHDGIGRPSVLRHADLVMDCARREVHRDGVLLTLTPKEFAVLEYLLTRAETAVPRADLIEHCWDEQTDPLSNVVDVVVKRLRAKLHEPVLIHAVRGIGYRLGAA